MARMTKDEAREIARRYGVNLSAPFHVLPWSQVDRVRDAADSRQYRKPKNANGSRARCFHEYLRRAANAPE